MVLLCDGHNWLKGLAVPCEIRGRIRDITTNVILINNLLTRQLYIIFFLTKDYTNYN